MAPSWDEIAGGESNLFLKAGAAGLGRARDQLPRQSLRRGIEGWWMAVLLKKMVSSLVCVHAGR